MKRRLQALGRLKPGQMNKTEGAYAKLLDQRQMAREVLWWKFEGIKLRLAPATFITVDFAIMEADGRLVMVDVKGARAIIADDGWAKLKIAAEQYPFEFRIAIPVRGGGWDEEVVG